jgi:lysophospholipase L1-like esterase
VGLSTGFSRYVAVGDSQTEGVGDVPYPDGTDRGWADRFASELVRSSPGLQYANLAIRGRRIRQIRDEQLGPALALEPDLVSVMAGLNDVIRPRFDLDRTLAHMEEMQRAFADQGATILTITFPEPSGLGPVGRLVHDRVIAFNRGLREVAAGSGARLLDLEPIGVTTDPRLWSHDRLHLNAEGHRRLAEGMLSLLGGPEVSMATIGSAEWALALPQVPRAARRARAAREAEWTLRYFLPWIGRRLTGRSSGDGRAAKRPVPGPPPADRAPGTA